MRNSLHALRYSTANEAFSLGTMTLVLRSDTSKLYPWNTYIEIYSLKLITKNYKEKLMFLKIQEEGQVYEKISSKKNRILHHILRHRNNPYGS